jgi:hypothetical protein
MKLVMSCVQRCKKLVLRWLVSPEIVAGRWYREADIKLDLFRFRFRFLPRSVIMACRGGVEDGAHPGVLDDEERESEEVAGVEEEEDGRGRRRRPCT